MNIEIKKQVQKLLDEGVYGYHDIFKRIYPTYRGHYNTLRMIIAEVKNA